MIDATRLRARIAALRPAFEAKLRALLEIPTVSAEPARRPEMDRSAELAASLVREAGGRADVVATAGNPLVLGRMGDDPGLPTVTVYNHLDVQPAEPSEWSTPPFTFTRDGDLYRGRGATDDKGPAVTALLGAMLARELGARCNVQFLWEHEEEIGSPHFEAGLRAAVAGDAAAGRAPFATESVVVSDTIWVAAGKPAIAYGLRGLAGFSITLETGAKDVHSGTTGGAARNPVAELAQLVSECHDARSGRVKIPGFYDDVRAVTAAERRGMARVGFSGEAFRGAHELRSLRVDSDAEIMDAVMCRPTFEVHGIAGGYHGPGIKTIVPHRAEAKVSMRLVPDQKPARMWKLIRDFVRRRCPDAKVTFEKALEPFLAPLGGPYNEAGARAMRETFGREPGFVREGGSIGAVLTMQEILGAPVSFLGLSLPEHGYHARNENYDWGQASGGMEMFARYFVALGELGRAPRGSAAAPRASGGARMPQRRRRAARR